MTMSGTLAWHSATLVRATHRASAHAANGRTPAETRSLLGRRPMPKRGDWAAVGLATRRVRV
jgi:hypothetical protein